LHQLNDTAGIVFYSKSYNVGCKNVAIANFAGAGANSFQVAQNLPLISRRAQFQGFQNELYPSRPSAQIVYLGDGWLARKTL
jgi:hypothetical protein